VHVFPVETSRLRTRPLSVEDEALYVHLYTDAETMHFIGAPLSAERAAKSFRVALAGMRRDPIEGLFLALIDKSTAAAVGICSLQNYDEPRRSVETGFMLVAAARSSGHTKECLRALTMRVFAELPVDELRVRIAPSHEAGWRTAISVGFTARQEGPPEDGIPQYGVWSVHRDTWRPPLL
jgi:RimJ/RimL family protein N-acetyltransferase